MKKFLQKRLTQEFAYGLVLISIVGAIILAIIVHLRPVLLTDIRITTEIQENRFIPLLPIMQLVSVFGDPPVTISVTITAALLFYLASCSREAVFTLLTFIADGLNDLIKLTIHRPRPSDTLVTVYERLTDSSFPSGHVVHYVVFFGFLAIALIMRDRLPSFLRLAATSVSLALIVLVSISRIYLGAHWATDVIGGYFVGYLLLSGLLYFYFDKNFLKNLPS